MLIKQTATGLDSREEAKIYDENGFLPLITAPMSSVVDEINYQAFWENKINICFPRTANLDEVHNDPCYKDSFHAISLEDFIKDFVINTRPIGSRPYKRCIDTANGNMPALHNAIRKAKEIHGDSLIIMAGNVGSVEAFGELAKTGVDYIRVGIGSGGACMTTSNTGVGQANLAKLVKNCRKLIKWCKTGYDELLDIYGGQSRKEVLESIYGKDWENIANVKIIADGISTYVEQCISKHRFSDNGYAAINSLLYAGADLVMIGKLFAQCLESAGEKNCKHYIEKNSWKNLKEAKESPTDYFADNLLYVKYSGMSTHEEQKNYRKPDVKVGDIFYLKKDIYNKVPIKCTMIEEGFTWGIAKNFPKCTEIGYSSDSIKTNIKPSEGSVNWIPVRWTLEEWLHGSHQNPNNLPGYINSLKSAKSYATNY